MKILVYYWPEVVVNATGLIAIIALNRRFRGVSVFLGWLGIVWLGFNTLTSVLGFLGMRPPASLMMFRGLGFALALCLVWVAALAWLGERLPAATGFSPNRRRVNRLAFYGALGAPFALAGYGTFIGRKQFRLVEVDLPIAQLPAGLDGLRLVQLSDIHLSPFLSRAELRWCVDLANETRADLGLVTGDLVTGTTEAIVPCLDELRRLKCPEGVFGCLGNHERYLEAEALTFQEGQRRDIHFLRDRGQELNIKSERLHLVGVDFKFSAETHFREFAYLRRPGFTNLLLCHNPALFPKTKPQGWDLVVAGHTHGGQLDFEIVERHLAPLRLATPYVYGTYREGGSLMYVSRGIGTVGVPARIGAPPEVALLRLRRA